MNKLRFIILAVLAALALYFFFNTERTTVKNLNIKTETQDTTRVIVE